jgi:hypothetical protein
MWMKRSEPPGVYLCRRDQFATSQVQQVMPVDPNWLPAALGLAEFSPQEQHEGPRLLPNQNLEVRSTVLGPSGPLVRVTVIDPLRAWVLEQHLYDGQGAPLASAIASQHRYYPEHQVSLPQRVDIRAPAAQLAMTIDVGQVYLNTHLGDAAQLWSPPQISGVPQIDVSGGVPAARRDTAARTAATTNWQPVHSLPLSNP